MKHILIIEDNTGQRNVLSSTLKALGPDYSIHECSTYADALQISGKLVIDLFFIDIGLPDGSGLDLAKTLRAMEQYELVWMVFLTTHSEYILEAFQKIHCYDYIVKPYKPETALQMAKKLTQGINTAVNATAPRFLSFDMRGFILKVNLDDIIFIEVFNKNITLHTQKQRHLIKRMSLKELLDMLPAESFVQCHRSYIVNPRYITRINKSNYVWEITFGSYKEIAYVGETYRSILLNSLKAGGQEELDGVL